MKSLGFQAKRKNRFAIFAKKNFSPTILIRFRISFAHEKCENFRFFLAKFRFNLFREKMRNFREVENAKISQKIAKNIIRKFRGKKNNKKLSQKNNAKISRKNVNHAKKHKKNCKKYIAS